MNTHAQLLRRDVIRLLRRRHVTRAVIERALILDFLRRVGASFEEQLWIRQHFELAFIGSTTNRSSGEVTSHNVTRTVTAGNFLVLFVGTFNELGAGGSVSGGGATWTRRCTSPAVNNVRSHIYEGIGATGGSSTITYTPADAAEVAVILAEFDAIAVSPFDVQQNASGTSTSPDTGATAALAQATSLKVSSCVHDGGNISMVPRSGDGDTQITGQTNGNTGMVIGGSYQLLSATTAVNGRWTIGASQNWSTGVAVFKMTAAGTTLSPSAGALALSGQQVRLGFAINIPTDTV